MCEHKRLKCTDNVLTCLDCGAVLPLELLAQLKAEQPEKPAKPAPKRGKKTKAD